MLLRVRRGKCSQAKSGVRLNAFLYSTQSQTNDPPAPHWPSHFLPIKTQVLRESSEYAQNPACRFRCTSALLTRSSPKMGRDGPGLGAKVTMRESFVVGRLLSQLVGEK